MEVVRPLKIGSVSLPLAAYTEQKSWSRDTLRKMSGMALIKEHHSLSLSLSVGSNFVSNLA
jgi:hypothetical protein